MGCFKAPTLCSVQRVVHYCVEWEDEDVDSAMLTYAVFQVPSGCAPHLWEGNALLSGEPCLCLSDTRHCRHSGGLGSKSLVSDGWSANPSFCRFRYNTVWLKGT